MKTLTTYITEAKKSFSIKDGDREAFATILGFATGDLGEGEDITVESYSRIAREASRATFFGLDENGVSQSDLIDLYDFTSELESYQTLTLPVQSAINDAVIYHKTNIEGCYGLSMYFPSTTRKMYSIVESNYKYGEMIVAENYRSFLNLLPI